MIRWIPSDASMKLDASLETEKNLRIINAYIIHSISCLTAKCLSSVPICYTAVQLTTNVAKIILRYLLNTKRISLPRLLILINYNKNI